MIKSPETHTQMLLLSRLLDNTFVALRSCRSRTNVEALEARPGRGKDGEQAKSPKRARNGFAATAKLAVGQRTCTVQQTDES